MKPGPFFSTRTIGHSSPAADASPIWAAYRELDRTQWLAPAEIEDLQMARLRPLLAHCVKHVPHYRAVLGSARIAPDDIQSREALRRLPILKRGTFQQGYADFQAQRLPGGTFFAGVTSTSGTSGVPIEVMQTNVGQLWWLALYLRDLEWCGIDPRGTLAAIRPAPWAMNAEQKRAYRAGTTLRSWHKALEPIIEMGPSHGMDIHEDPRRQLAWLRQIAPNYLLSYPSHLDFLASLIVESGEPLAGLRAIQTVSEVLTEDVRHRIEHAFGVPVKPLYSCGEAGYLASPCPAGNGLHVHAEHVILEVLNEAGMPCRPGETGRAVLTNLHNFLTPLIRYEIMDEVTLGPTPCPCGRGLPLLTRVEGKRRPMLRLPDGNAKHSDGLGLDLRSVPGLLQYQLIQRDVDDILVRVVPGRGWTSYHPDRVRQLVRDFFEAPVHIDVEEQERLEPPPSGKLQDIICAIPPEARHRSSNLAGAKTTAARNGTASQSGDSRARGRSGGENTVLLGWELGAGLGHIRPLLALGRALAAHGCRPVLVLKNPEAFRADPQGHGLECRQAPLTPARAWSDRPVLAASYADILALHGYGDVQALMPMLEAWQALLDDIQPDLVICDHSPTLCLAAYGVIPTVVMGNGFGVPPSEHGTFPLLLPGQPLLIPEPELLGTIWEVQRRRGRPAPMNLPLLLGGSERFVTVLPELDPYQGKRTEPCVGPLEPLLQPMPWPRSPRYFAYLGTEAPGINETLAGLARTRFPGKIFLRGASSSARDEMRRHGLDALAELPAPEVVLAEASVVIHLGGSGMAQQAMAAGRPQLLLPYHLEQVLNAQMIHAFGVGSYIVGNASPGELAAELSGMLEDRNVTERALSRAAAIQARGPWMPLSRIVERCLGLLQSEYSSSHQFEVAHHE